MNERTDRMVKILGEEWDNVIVLCSRYKDGQTQMFRYMLGNALANHKQMEDTIDCMMFAGDDDDMEEIYGDEE